ncbi:lysophospholipid acyltransferase family protein [Dasania sp. GY-MA-18]|uniref:Lysophospholipid acyltransferase family protein n=1 Tax=Dasania phycosphaerae TaxID=2950436 RepID=A0A9J6RQI6_9GAMM|nr:MULTISPECIES: lysophospholipid acyltransferase family protein [Dasania]MCR8924045.1 lysophospholipid acyltransferase family protein [Dasania sp. GY-MA-18]MCZ0866618.1 lysophospholipid acyltransferase family protein [Dasania phycosphaerae]MCZ0870203.1 lysophospholipid acyltransferase family protein [Dasania phycosphaerae]
MKLLIALLAKLPLASLYKLSNGLYWLAYYLVRYRRDIVRSNLSQAFPDKSLAEIIRIEKDYYRFICDNFMEAIASQNISAEELASRFEFTNLELIQPYLDNKQSLQLLSIHQGGWEWLVQLLPYKLKAPVDAIYKPLHDDFFDAIFLANRSKLGTQLIPSSKAMKHILRKRKEFHLITMTADQAPIRKDKKYWQMFFNRPAPFYLGSQKIAELTQNPVVYFAVHRVKRGYYKVTFEIIAQPPYAKNSYQVLDNYIAAMQRAITAQPETWLWSNRKWRRSPSGDSSDIFAEDFPKHQYLPEQNQP